MDIFTKQWWTDVLQLNESPPIEFERDEYQEYVLQNRDKIEKTATVFNLPIPDLEFAFNAGSEVVLSDDIWSKLENSKSYNIKSLDDAIQHALKIGVNPKQYIDFIKEGKELPLPLILCYGPDKYYLVGGEVILSLYKALGSIPTVLQGTLNLNMKENLDENNEEVNGIIKTFLKFAIKELGLTDIPKITISNNTEKVKNNHSFASYNPEDNSIWLYVKGRTPADFLRSLAHELKHSQQNEKGLLNPNSGETGSNEEDAANAGAGVLMRNFGKLYPQIFNSKGYYDPEDMIQSLGEGVYGDHLFGGEESGVKIKWYNQELEKDTTAEKELFDKLRIYADSEYDTYSNINLDGLLPLFQKLKKEYPNIVNPNLDNHQYIYRGTVTGVERLEQLRQDPKAVIDKRNIIIPNQEYSSKRRISSWSTNYFNAASFAITSADKKGMVPLVVRAKITDADLYFNPEFMSKLSTQPEEEVLNATNPIRVDVMIIQGFDTEFEQDSLNEVFSKEWWKEILK